MKVLIVVGANIRYCPYANYYINILKKENIPFEVIYPDRKKLDDNYDFPTISYNWNENSKKMKEYFKFRQFVIKEIKRNDYCCVILLTTIIAVLFGGILKRKKIKYLVDIRDYTHEHIRLYYFLESKAINNSLCTVISSPDFRKFLPRYEYLDVYNFPQTAIKHNCTFKKNTDNNPIIISYIGTIAYHDQCEELMKLVENDNRFEFHLYGNDLYYDRIKKYIKDNNLKNSKYFGAYKPEDKEEIIESSDILFNAYGNNSPLLLYALSNKLTDATIYKKPVLNSPNTSMHKFLGICSFAMDFKDNNELNDLFDWYHKLDPIQVHNTFESLYNKIVTTNENTSIRVRECIQNCFLR